MVEGVRNLTPELGLVAESRTHLYFLLMNHQQQAVLPWFQYQLPALLIPLGVSP